MNDQPQLVSEVCNLGDGYETFRATVGDGQMATFRLDLVEANGILDQIAKDPALFSRSVYDSRGDVNLEEPKLTPGFETLSALAYWVRFRGGPRLRAAQCDALQHELRRRFFAHKQRQKEELDTLYRCLGLTGAGSPDSGLEEENVGEDELPS